MEILGSAALLAVKRRFEKAAESAREMKRDLKREERRWRRLMSGAQWSERQVRRLRRI
jgi:hypothetical protein